MVYCETTRVTAMMISKKLPIIYQWICASFCVIVVLSNLISAKMVTLPGLAVSIPAGLLPYPLTFLLSDLVTEIFGATRAKRMVYMALAMCLVSFGMIQLVLWLPASSISEQQAFQAVLGLSGLRIFASLASYITAQLVDIRLYATIKRWTGPQWMWLRNNGSTCASQLLDTVLVDLIFLWWGLGMAMRDVTAIMLFSYLYKAGFSVACTPVLYALVYLIRGGMRPTRSDAFPVVAIT